MCVCVCVCECMCVCVCRYTSSNTVTRYVNDLCHMILVKKTLSKIIQFAKPYVSFCVR